MRPTKFGPKRCPDTYSRPAHWDRRAACREADPGLFFPEGTAEEVRDRTAAAKEICRVCSVSGACQIEALERREQYGVWGGLDEEERRSILRLAAKRAAERAAERAKAEEVEEAADACAPTTPPTAAAA